VLNMHDFYYYSLSLPMQKEHRINQLKTSLPLDEHFKLVVWWIPTLSQTVKILHKGTHLWKEATKNVMFLLQQKIVVP
jgi:hypothetical protein